MMIKEYRHLIKLQRFFMEQMHLKCENEMLSKDKLNEFDEGIDIDNTMIEDIDTDKDNTEDIDKDNTEDIDEDKTGTKDKDKDNYKAITR